MAHCVRLGRGRRLECSTAPGALVFDEFRRKHAVQDLFHLILALFLQLAENSADLYLGLANDSLSWTSVSGSGEMHQTSRSITGIGVL